MINNSFKVVVIFKKPNDNWSNLPPANHGQGGMPLLLGQSRFLLVVRPEYKKWPSR